MYNKTKSPFENYWLAVTEVNLKFSQKVTKLNPNKYKGYAEQNAWLGCGKSADSVLQRRCASSEVLALSLTNRKEEKTRKFVDFIENTSGVEVKSQRPKKQLEIYQEHQNLTDSIISTLKRINARQQAKREESGIKTNIQKGISADEAVAVALRAALRNRK